MTYRAIAYPASWRISAALLTVISRGSLLVLVAILLFLDAWLSTPLRLTNPLRLLRAFAVLCLVPGVGVWLLERVFEVKVLFQGGALVLQRRRQRIEIPSAAIERAAPWAVPLPAGGLWLRLKSGRRFRYGLQVADPVAFIDALVQVGAPPSVRDASQLPAAIYTRSKIGVSPRWYHRILKFVVLALVPALPLFRLHQWISYGGTFGEYYMYGLKAYLLGLGIYWAAASVYLVLYAAVLRAIAEPIVWAAAYLAPLQTSRVRRAVEIANRLLYYGGVLLFLLRLYLSS
jgi:apolipoprotein N-acyltransferase